MAEGVSTSRYQVFSLSVKSEIQLPELEPADTDSDPDVDIRWAETPHLDDERSGYNVAPGGTLLLVQGVARYWISDGSSIVVEPHRTASERNVRLYLLGSALGALLHQRRLLPLHANAVAIEGRAVLFAGHSGAGKSTMAAWFHDRGFRLLTDDVCAVTRDGQGRFIAHPGIPRLRLMSDAVIATGRRVEDLEPAFDEWEKFNVSIAAEARAAALPLGQIYLLARAAEGEVEGSIRRLTGADAVSALMGNTYRGEYLRSIEGTQEHMLTCVAIARRIPIFVAKRRWGHDALDRQAYGLEEHVRRTMLGEEAAFTADS